jgi:peptidoglycan/xylan/chitin deacetylase (PgdA/CDA1 family)
MPLPRVIALAPLAGLAAFAALSSGPVRTMAITFDDLPAASAVEQDSVTLARMTDRLLRALRHNRIPAIGFVNEGKLYREGQLDSGRVELLRRWLQAGFELGNHTFSHLSLHRVSLPDYEADLLRGEAVTRPLAAAAGRPPRYFRHPYLHTGRDSATRAGLEQFLAAHGYRVAPVTVDNYDYVFAAAFDRSDRRGEPALADSVRRAYLPYLLQTVDYYQRQAEALFGRPIPQVLLLHASRLNSLELDHLVRELRRRGYRFVPLDSALADSAYRSPDRYYGPAGITWLHRWALTAGKRGAFFAGEPEVPEWVSRLAAPPP